MNQKELSKEELTFINGGSDKADEIMGKFWHGVGYVGYYIAEGLAAANGDYYDNVFHTN